jgi:hypothetical protein
LPPVVDDGLTFLAASKSGSIVGGAIVNRTDGVVGVSNIFARSIPRPEVWSGCLEAISGWFPDLPIVGYESGASLREAVEQGFRPLGPLQVWQRVDESA